MTKILVTLAVLLILSGVILLAIPREEPTAARGLQPESVAVQQTYSQVREIAEQVNAPLSILLGLFSLYYSRRTYLVNRDRHGPRGPAA